MLIRPAEFDRDRPRLDGFLHAAAAAEKREVLSERKVMQYAADSASGLVAVLDGSIAAYVHVAPPVDGTSEIETVVHPDHRRRLDWSALVEASVDAARPAAGHHWAHLPEHTAALEMLGLEHWRHLLLMRRPLPPGKRPSFPASVAVRSFHPDDADAFLAAHVAAFHGHPETGQWDRRWLDGRQAARWFEPEGFLLAIESDAIAAYCWTKMHSETLGEIFLIGVAPGHRRRGLGSAISLAGLWHLSDAGCTEAMLFADASNRSGVAMYETLGFVVAREDRCYR